MDNQTHQSPAGVEAGANDGVGLRARPVQEQWNVRRQSDTLQDDVTLPEETVAVRGEARAFAEKVLAPIAHELNCTPESRDAFRRDVFDAMAEAGLFAVPFAQDVGGRGLQYPTLAALTVLEEIAYFSPGVASAMYDAQILLVGTVLDTAGGDLREVYLPRLIRGAFVGCFATSEPGASTDLSVGSIETVADPAPGGWNINGRKRWITNAPAGEHVVLLCRTGQSLSLFFVDMRHDGVEVGDPDLKMGNHAQLTADITFRDVFVPDNHVMGDVGAGLRGALGALALGRMGIGTVGVAMAQRALDLAVAYTQKRHVYGRPIAANQHWQFRFAEHALEIEAARLLCQKAALLTDRGGQPGVLPAMAKVKGSALAVDVARDAVQCCGGYGFVKTLVGAGENWPIESIYRDAKIGEIYEGANEIQKWIIARSIFGRAITG